MIGIGLFFPSFFTEDWVAAILQLPKLSPDLEDRKIWALETKGHFSIKSAYESFKGWSQNPKIGWSHFD